MTHLSIPFVPHATWKVLWIVRVFPHKIDHHDPHMDHLTHLPHPSPHFVLELESQTRGLPERGEPNAVRPPLCEASVVLSITLSSQSPTYTLI